MAASVFREGLYRGRVVFVTGGSSGINLGLAEAFGLAGAKVAINGRNLEKLARAVEGLRQQGIVAEGYPADVREYQALEGAISQAVETLGPIDVLVCGAAGNFPAPAMAISPNGFKAVVDIDLLGTFNACRAAFERLNKPGASVLNITAPQAAFPYALQSHVCAAKAGVDMLTRTLALEWGPAGVRVNAVSPGPILETGGMARLAGSPESQARLAQAMPLQRLGTKADVAQLALFLASDAASYCTGGVYPADGGMGLLGGAALLQVT
jgi:NAD(P)-dependent dehydrogenase (short-subunit alcohol dehydrogenase family)